jgi:hypothetical protein
MKKLGYVLACMFTFLYGHTVQAQMNDVTRRIVEVKKMVDIDSEQEARLAELVRIYYATIDSILLKVDDKITASALIRDAKETYNKQFQALLSGKQMEEYIRVSAHDEITDKTAGKLNTLRESGKYSEADLQQFSVQIFEYYMLEKVVYVREKYNNEKLKENISQLKKYEPQCLKSANALQKAKQEGVVYQGGYKW